MPVLYRQANVDFARKLRQESTDAEQQLWTKLRRRQLGPRFYRQRPLGPFILDFYSPSVRLCVEVDGSQHHEEAGRASDCQRDAWLNSHEIQVLRFTNREVLTQLPAVLEEIYEAIQKRTRRWE